MPKGVPKLGYRVTPNLISGLRQITTSHFHKESDHSDQRFTIHERFEFLEKLILMVARGVQPSAVITGRGGLGKTYTVLKTLKGAGYEDVSGVDAELVGYGTNFRMVKGYSTAKGLYRTLFENQDSVIVFDDTDAVLDNEVSLNLLKAALDSYDRRIVSWNAELKGDDLPKSFEFKGRIIFISNRSQHSIDQAVRSRSMMVDLSMTSREMIDRMEYISRQSSFMPEAEMLHKKESINFIRENVSLVRDMSLRTLISVIKIRSTNEDWRSFASYVIAS